MPGIGGILLPLIYSLPSGLGLLFRLIDIRVAKLSPNPPLRSTKIDQRWEGQVSVFVNQTLWASALSLLYSQPNCSYGPSLYWLCRFGLSVSGLHIAGIGR